MPGVFPTETLSLSLNDAHAYMGSIIQFGRGIFALDQPVNEPANPLELYEFEGCPYCRKVREVLTELDLNYISRTCGKNSYKRQYVEEKGGKTQFPFLVDPNHDQSMYESEDIIDYLCDTYFDGRGTLARLLSPVNTARSTLPSLWRPKGISVRSGYEDREQPEKLLELYNFEGSPFCRKVREVLCELNLDYHVHNVGKGSPRRDELERIGGKIQVPYLIDPNTGTLLYESYDIVDHLEAKDG